MLTKQNTRREAARSIPGEPQFLRSTDGEALLREDRCPCGRLLGKSTIPLGRGIYAQHETVCKRCRDRVLITLSTSP